MLSESARMSSAAEARFRVQAPNSRPRVVKVIALDATAQDVVRRLAGAGWNQATFFSAAGDMLADLAGRTSRVADEVQTADLVVLVAGPGGRAEAAAPIGQACSLRRVMTTGFVVGVTSGSESQSALSKTLAQLRPWSLMVVIADSDEYIDDMLTALRA
jgi:hypothetical protein